MSPSDSSVAATGPEGEPELLDSKVLVGIARMRRGLEDGLGALVFLTLASMTVTVFSGVVSRYVFNSALSWTEEFAIWAFTWLIFLGAALGVARDAHIGVALLSVPKSPRARLVF